jgi:tetratricopeptide (TPR) repeat protein
MPASVLVLVLFGLPDAPTRKAPAETVKPASVAVGRTSGEAEPAAAREAARRCDRADLPLDEAIAVCREALRLGAREPRRTALRHLLAERLAEARRFDELVALYQEETTEHPQEPEAWRHLGSAQLFLKEDAEGALPALEAASRLRPDDALARVLLGICLNALARHAEAVAAFEAALRLDADALSLRPAAKAVLEASRRGERWP